MPLFGTLIALLHEGQPVLGCIHQPILRQLLIGDHRTAELNGALVPVVRGAGGVITDWQGGPAYPATSAVAAATPELNAAVLAALDGRGDGAG